MKTMMPLMAYDDLHAIKDNMQTYAERFSEDTGEWIPEALGHPAFIDSRYRMPDARPDPSLPDIDNVKTIYEGFHFLSNAQASDERLWAALCLGPYWDYVQQRCNTKKEHAAKDILHHYFFGYGLRRSLTRNAIARLWWIGRLTYDEKAENHYEMTEWIFRDQDHIISCLERNFSNNFAVLQPFIHAVMDAQKEGVIGTNDRYNVRRLAMYLDELGGTYILDCLTEETIHDKVLHKAEELWG